MRSLLSVSPTVTVFLVNCSFFKAELKRKHKLLRWLVWFHVSMELQRQHFSYQHKYGFVVLKKGKQQGKKTLFPQLLDAAPASPVHLKRNENVPEAPSVSRRLQSGPVPASVSGVLAVGAVAHVFRVELHLDGDAVETELGVEQLGGLLQYRLSVGALLWCEIRPRKTTVSNSNCYLPLLLISFPPRQEPLTKFAKRRPLEWKGNFSPSYTIEASQVSVLPVDRVSNGLRLPVGVRGEP